MATIGGKNNLYWFERANLNAVSGAIRAADPDADAGEAGRWARGVIRGAFIEAAAELATRKSVGGVLQVALGGFVVGAGVVVTSLNAPWGIAFVIVGGGVFAALGGSRLDSNRDAAAMLKNQFDPGNDYDLNPDAAGNKKVYELAQRKIVAYVKKKMDGPVPA